MMNAGVLKDLEASVIDVASKASEKIMQVYETAFAVEKKDDKSPVTEADLAANEVISQGLSKLMPELPVLSEEGTSLSYAERKQWSSYWLVDPLDGTREFVKRSDEFAIIIALIEDGKPILGVVMAPALKKVYFASKGNGAYKQEANEEPQAIQVRPVTETNLVITGSRSHGASELGQFLERIGEYELVSMGSALKVCLVAEGKADLYPRFGPTSEWDTAGAQCILEEAGGNLTDADMRPLLYNTKESLLNPNFFAFGDRDYDWSKYL